MKKHDVLCATYRVNSMVVPRAVDFLELHIAEHFKKPRAVEVVDR